MNDWSVVRLKILSRVGYITRQITSRHIRYSEFIAYSLLHSHNSQLYKYCHVKYHKYFYCSWRLLGFNCTLWLHDPHCVTLDHTLSSLTESSLPPYAVQFSYKPSARQRENGSFPCCVPTVFTACLATVVSRAALLPDVVFTSVVRQRCQELFTAL
jgi:hypothetical protein